MIIENEKEYLKNIVHYLNVTKTKITINELKKMCADLFNTEIEVEFLMDEIDLANDIIEDNDYLSFIDYINDKKNMARSVERNMLLENIDNLWEYIMHNAYSIWQNNDMSRDEFLSKISPYEKLAVQFGNLNYQVENGGLQQWDDNGYSSDYEDLHSFIENSSFSKKDEFLNFFEVFDYVKNEIKKLNPNDDFYDQDCQTRYDYLNGMEKEYQLFKEEWFNYFQKYLIVSMPNEYVEKIKEYNQNIKI